MASPLEISIAIWYRTRARDYGKGAGEENYGAPIVQEILKEFLKAGLLGLSPAGSETTYYGTDALGIYVDELCNVPWPIQQWVIPKRA